MGKETKNIRTLMPRAPKGLVVEKKELKEEYGPFRDYQFCKDVAQSLEDGIDKGRTPEDIEWSLTIWGNGKDDIDSREDFHSYEFYDEILYNIAYAVKEGHLHYDGFDMLITASMFKDKKDVAYDLIRLFDVDDRDVRKFLSDDEYELEFYFDFDIDFDLDDFDRVYEEGEYEVDESMKKSMKESVERTRAEEAAHTIDKVLLNDNIYADVYVVSENPDIVDVDIHWGDWKHDHGRADWLIGLLFPDSKIEIEETETNGSDTYSAIHHVYLNMDEDDGEIASERKYSAMNEDFDFPAEEVPVEEEPTPEPGPDMGVANLLITLINGEWDTIKDYNDFIATISAEGGYDDMLAAIQDIVSEENVHVGQLQKLLQQISPDALKIAQGEQEAQEQIDGENEPEKIDEPVEPEEK